MSFTVEGSVQNALPFEIREKAAFGRRFKLFVEKFVALPCDESSPDRRKTIAK